MSRPLSLLLAAAMAVSAPAFSAAPAAAQGVYFTAKSGEWDNDNWRWGNRRHHRHDFRPGFSFSFGVPFPPVYSYYYPRRSRDCYREWDGRVYCRAY
jgi:hypothetical protein